MILYLFHLRTKIYATSPNILTGGHPRRNGIITHKSIKAHRSALPSNHPKLNDFSFNTEDRDKILDKAWKLEQTINKKCRFGLT